MDALLMYFTPKAIPSSRRKILFDSDLFHAAQVIICRYIFLQTFSILSKDTFFSHNCFLLSVPRSKTPISKNNIIASKYIQKFSSRYFVANNMLRLPRFARDNIFLHSNYENVPTVSGVSNLLLNNIAFFLLEPFFRRRKAQIFCCFFKTVGGFESRNFFTFHIFRRSHESFELEILCRY